MRIVTLLVVSALSAIAGKHTAAEEEMVRVYVNQNTSIPSEVLMRAERKASLMFTKAGVKIDWLMRQYNPKKPIDGRTIVLKIAGDTPLDLLPGALGMSQPFECIHITIFYDRIAIAPLPLVPGLLAHVMVHEITHLLQRVDGHSEIGVMKAHWSETEVNQMALGMLPFTEADVQLIHNGIAARSGCR